MHRKIFLLFFELLLIVNIFVKICANYLENLNNLTHNTLNTCIINVSKMFLEKQFIITGFLKY